MDSAAPVGVDISRPDTILSNGEEMETPMETAMHRDLRLGHEIRALERDKTAWIRYRRPAWEAVVREIERQIQSRVNQMTDGKRLL